MTHGPFPPMPETKPAKATEDPAAVEIRQLLARLNDAVSKANDARIEVEYTVLDVTNMGCVVPLSRIEAQIKKHL